MHVLCIYSKAQVEKISSPLPCSIVLISFINGEFRNVAVISCISPEQIAYALGMIRLKMPAKRLVFK